MIASPFDGRYYLPFDRFPARPQVQNKLKATVQTKPPASKTETGGMAT
ncbi:MAG: hypothetical protein ACJAWN_000947 [Neolewinella sp.]|jgi:hypothetical protein